MDLIEIYWNERLGYIDSPTGGSIIKDLSSVGSPVIMAGDSINNPRSLEAATRKAECFGASAFCRSQGNSVDIAVQFFDLTDVQVTPSLRNQFKREFDWTPVYWISERGYFTTEPIEKPKIEILELTGSPIVIPYRTWDKFKGVVRQRAPPEAMGYCASENRSIDVKAVQFFKTVLGRRLRNNLWRE